MSPRARTEVPIKVTEVPDPPPGELIDLLDMVLTSYGLQQDLWAKGRSFPLITTALGINDDPQYYGKALWLRTGIIHKDGERFTISWKIQEQAGGYLILIPSLHKVTE